MGLRFKVVLQKIKDFMKLILILIFCISFVAGAKNYPGSDKAKKGGDFYLSILAPPVSLNPLSYEDGYAVSVFDYVFDSLLTLDPDTYEWQPSLAESWNISKDGLTFEFKLRPGITWPDGTKLSTQDIKFSFEAITDPDNKYNTAAKKPYYENIKEVQIVDEYTVKFICKEKYFKNFEVTAGLTVIPKHIYQDSSKENFKKYLLNPIGSGPYVLKSFDRNKKLVLLKREDWWGEKLESNKGRYNFDRIHMKFVSEPTIEITMLEKGELDFSGLNPEQYMKQTSGKKWGKEITKEKVENSGPKGYTFIAWNFKDKRFTSQKTRLALYHLINRKLMNEKFSHNMSNLTAGPLYHQSPYVDSSVKPVNYDPKAAIALLKADGWSDSDGDKILDKVIDGQKYTLSFTILEPYQDFVKYLTVFKEDASKVGVEVKIKFVEWNTFVKLLDEKKFEALRLAWGGGSVDWEPKQIWHSKSAEGGGSNFISYSNPEVDKLIDSSKSIMNKNDRIKTLKKVYKLIANDVPYAFLFNPKYSLYAKNKKVMTPKKTYKYELGKSYWWF